MIQSLITIMDEAVTLPIVTRNGLCELGPNPSGGTQPLRHVGGGEFRPVADDTTGSWSYWRLMNDGLRVDPADVKAACEGVQYTLRLRLVMMVERSGPCADITGALMGMVNSVRGTSRALRTAAGAINVTFPTMGLLLGGLDASEFGSAGRNIPTGMSLVGADFTVVVLGSEGCLITCN